MRYFFVYFLVSFLAIQVAISQSDRVDALKSELRKSQNDSLNSILYISLSELYSKTNLDSALFYVEKAQRIVDKFISKELWAQGRMGDVKRELGNIHYYKKDFDSAISYYQSAVQVFETLSNNGDSLLVLQYKKSMSDVIVNLSLVYTNKGNYDKALEQYLRALKIYESLNNVKGAASCNLGVGTLLYYQADYPKAIVYFNQAYNLYQKANDKSAVANVLNALGSVYYVTNDFVKAIDHFKKSLDVKVEMKDKTGISSAYSNLASVYMNTGEYDLAIDYYNKGLNIDKELGDLYGVAINEANIARLYFEMSKVDITGSKREEYLVKALQMSKEAYSKSIKLGVLPLKNNISELLISIHRSLGNYREATSYFDTYIATKDSLFSQDKTDALAEMQTKYETEKKEQEISNQQLIIEKQEAINKRQLVQRNFLIVGSALLLLLVFIAYGAYKQKKKSNKVIAEKNIALKTANEEILAQNEEIEAQRDMVIAQKEKIEEAHNHITQSLQYAQSIQSSILPSVGVFESISPEYFVVMKPKDIVSGDFFWATTFDEYRIFCVADCTGHGVPGAFMSILGISSLNEIISKNKKSNPAQILDLMRQNVIDTLGKNQIGHKDGIDIALCVINTTNRELHYSGARIPVWIVAEENTELGDQFLNNDFLEADGYKLAQVKADIMPVGFIDKMEPFTEQVIKLPDNKVSVYIASDGFSDQFGKSDGKKYSVKRLKHFILRNAGKTFKEQGLMLEEDFQTWKGDGEQIDDVTVFGIRL